LVMSKAAATVCIFLTKSAATLMLLASLVACGGGGAAPVPSTSSSASPNSSNSSSSASLAGRATLDRPDKYLDQYQVHVIYAVPSDKQDMQRDTKGIFAMSLRAANNFFAKSTGQKIRFDETAEGDLDVSFLALPNGDSHYASKLAFAREAVQADVRTAGFNDARKIYLVYYEGTNDSSCGNAPSVGTGDGVTLLYLQGLGGTSFACANNKFSADPAVAGYWEFATLHEIVHTLSFVDACAPHGKDNHTTDDPGDLMYAGSQSWQPVGIDPGQDDYYGVNVPRSCPRNLMYSAFLEPQLGSEVPINFPHN
jgi:hypothetical protein